MTYLKEEDPLAQIILVTVIMDIVIIDMGKIGIIIKRIIIIPADEIIPKGEKVIIKIRLKGLLKIPGKILIKDQTQHPELTATKGHDQVIGKILIKDQTQHPELTATKGHDQVIGKILIKDQTQHPELTATKGLDQVIGKILIKDQTQHPELTATKGHDQVIGKILIKDQTQHPELTATKGLDQVMGKTILARENPGRIIKKDHTKNHDQNRGNSCFVAEPLRRVKKKTIDDRFLAAGAK